MFKVKSIKEDTLREKLLNFCYVFNAIIFSGWIFVYPYAGYFSLAFSILIFFLLEVKVLKHFFVLSSFFLILLYLFLPREFGPPNTAWILSLLSFLTIFYLNRRNIVKIFEIYINFIILLCILSLFFRVMSLFLPLPFRFIDLEPQFFNLYWPFYVERINISSADTDLIIGSFRFHGPFFEPGAIGYVLGICLFGPNSIKKTLLIIFFGLLSFSMAFLALLFIFIFEKFLKERNFKPLFFIAIIAIYFYTTLDKDGFIYTSSFGRILGDGDKVLNTRLSVFEQDQLNYFYNTFLNSPWKLLFGSGFNIPGSGGAGRVWLISTGLLLTLIYFISFIYLLKRFYVLSLEILIFRFPALLICLYILGNWLSLIFLFIFIHNKKNV